MTIKLTDAIAALAASLIDAASIFGDADSDDAKAAFTRHIKAAAKDFDRVLPLVLEGALTLVPNVRNYVAPPQALKFQATSLIDDNVERDIDDPYRVDTVPTPQITVANGTKTWSFRPTPSNAMLSKLGTDYPYTYFSAHQVNDDDTSTIDDDLLPLLVMRAQVESLREIGIRNAHKPMQTRDPVYSQTRNGTPAGLADLTMTLWEQQVREASGIFGARV